MINIKSILWKIKSFFSPLFGRFKTKSRVDGDQEKPDPLQYQLDKKLVSSLNDKKLPSPKQLKHIFKVLSKSEANAVRALLIVIAVSVFILGGNFYFKNFEVVPVKGGEYTEGLVGAPQYINPLLSQTNDVDSDIASLVFSGLMGYDQNLELTLDLAKDFQISEDFKSYIFNLREDVFWHDGKKLTADDVVFTFKSAQDQNFKSPLLVSLRGVAVKKTGDYQVTFTLGEPYPFFLEVLTMGILPEHIWGEIPPINANLTEYNLKPIGSGPWQFKSLLKDRLGNIKSYTLVPNQKYYDKIPYLQSLTFKFYPDFPTAVSALNNQSIEGISYVPKELKNEITNKYLKFYSFNLPQYTAIFFNQKNNEALKNKSIRKALALAIDKTKILTEALRLEGEIIDGPILPGFIGYNPSLEKIPYDPASAEKTLDETGFKKISSEEYQEFIRSQQKKNEDSTAVKSEATTTVEAEIVTEQPFYRKKDDKILEVKLTTVNLSENVLAAELIKEFWQKIGVKVNLEIVDASQISREVIRNRNYEALLYGEIVGVDPDPYPFWHSSQNQDPGLNLAVFANRKVDALLEEARATSELEKREAKYLEFQDILVKELPAIFLYTPTYTYVVSEKIKGIKVDKISVPYNRFNNLSFWYLKTGRRWQGAAE